MDDSKQDDRSKIRSACDACSESIDHDYFETGYSDLKLDRVEKAQMLRYSAQLPSGRPSKRKARCLDDGFSTILELGGSEFVPSSNWDDSFDGLDGNNDDIVPAPTDPSAGAWATPPDDFSNMLMSDMFMHPTLPGHSHHSDYASLIIDEAGRRQQPSCSCFGLVQGCLLDVRSRDSTSTSLELLQMLRRARETTEKILKCSTCFHMEKTTVEGGGNILLLGHLVSTIASAYADFFNIVNTSADLGVKKSFTIGDADHVNQTMQVELSGNPYPYAMASRIDNGGAIHKVTKIASLGGLVRTGHPGDREIHRMLVPTKKIQASCFHASASWNKLQSRFEEFIGS
ncbi:MAG: hypothetical protein MMC23_005936 [Stictis urceolatum]|nr:hypothetical protein [Stictis urceolata]